MELIRLVTLAICILHVSAGPFLGQQDLTRGANQFSTNLYNSISKNARENLVVSPISAYFALGIASFGANGTTLATLRSRLFLNEEHPIAARQLATTLQQLTINDRFIVQTVNNKIYTSDRVIPKAKFNEILSKLFNTKADQLDFANPWHATQIMNRWVDISTNHKIREIISERDINAYTAMVILNTIYFNANWWDPFESKYNVMQPFYVDRFTTKDVQMMYMLNDNLVYGKVEYPYWGVQADFVELPYWENKAKMIIITPQEGYSLSAVEANLHLFSDDHLVKTSGPMNLYMPSFKIESVIDLQEPLRKMGMGDIFATDANFDGIGENAYLTKITQKVVVEVNEKGTEAGVSTAGLFQSRMLTQSKRKINRPSLAIIRVNGFDVFIIRLVDPQQSISEQFIPNNYRNRIWN